jgi:hypothetical protein
MDTDLPCADELLPLLYAGHDPFRSAQPHDRVHIRQGDLDLQSFRPLMEEWDYTIERSYPSLADSKWGMIHIWRRAMLKERSRRQTPVASSNSPKDARASRLGGKPDGKAPALE